MVNHINFINACYPESIDVDDILALCKEEGKENRNNRQYILYLLNTITRKSYQKENEEHNFNTFITLNSDIFKRILTTRNYHLIDILKKYEAIETKKNSEGKEIYSTGKGSTPAFSKGYRFTKKHTKSKLKFEQITLKSLVTKIKKANDDKKKKLLKTSYIANVVSSIKDLRFNYDDALDFIESQNFNIEKYNFWVLQLENLKKINDTNLILTTDGNGRLYHNVTSLPTKLLELCYWKNGQPLLEIDISNCAPYLLNKIILNKYKLKSFSDDLPTDILEYAEITSGGYLYEHLMAYEGLDYNNPIERREYKTKFFKSVFYGKYHNSRYFKNFKQIFPNVAAVIIEAKKYNYEDLSNKLMNVESDLMIKMVLPRLYKHKKSLSIITKHDAIICKEKDTFLINNIIQECCYDFIDLVPTIKEAKIISK